MSSLYVPLSLSEATLTVWLADTNGDPTGDALFTGAPVHGVQMAASYTEVLSACSGRSYRQTRHVDEEHTIALDRTWVLRANDAAQSVLSRGVTYVLALTWAVAGPDAPTVRWTNTRTYYGVTWQGGSWRSEGFHAFGTGQSFRAQRFTETGAAVSPVVPPGGGGTDTGDFSYWLAGVPLVGP